MINSSEKMLFRSVWIFCILFPSLFVIQITAKQIYGSFKDEKYPAACVINDKISVPHMGTIKDPFVDCGLLICGKNSVVEIKSCPLQVEQPNCKLGRLINSSLPYPQCCEREVKCQN